MKEIWKDIKGFEGYYQVSNKGDIRSLNYHNSGKVHIMKLQRHKFGYRIIGLVIDGAHYTLTVSKLVAEAFVPNPNNYDCVKYKDGNKDNICADNLEWVSRYTISRIGGKIGGKRSAKRIKKDFIAQYDLEGNLIDVWESIHKITATNTDYTDSNIRRCCVGIIKSAYGYKWEYV